MKHYSDAFLGLILAGVVMMLVGLGLMISPIYFRPAPAAISNELLQADLPKAMRLSANKNTPLIGSNIYKLTGS